MQTVDQLADILQFKTEVMTQMPVVGTLLAGVAAGSAVSLAASAERSRARACLLAVFTVSALVFIFATVLDVCILPAMKRHATQQQAGAMLGLLNLSEVVVWGILAGFILLTGALAGLGFLYSRRLGAATVLAGAALSAGLTACLFYLDAVVRRG